MSEPHVKAVEEHYDRTAARWEGIYDSPTFHDHLIADRMRRALDLVARTGATGRALDAGCGAGQMVAELASRGFETAGFDISANMVTASQQLLARRSLAADVVQANGEGLPHESGSFDVVTALGYIEYFPSPPRAVAELTRVAAPGGHLVVTSPNPIRIAYLLDPIGTVRGLLRPEQGYRRHYYSARSLRRLLTAAGLEVLAIEGHGIGPWTVAGRPVLSDARSIAIDRRLEWLPARVRAVLGADLVALARKPAAR
jgi:SAM-dependent methyltransferase